MQSSSLGLGTSAAWSSHSEDAHSEISSHVDVCRAPEGPQRHRCVPVPAPGARRHHRWVSNKAPPPAKPAPHWPGWRLAVSLSERICRSCSRPAAGPRCCARRHRPRLHIHDDVPARALPAPPGESPHAPCKASGLLRLRALRLSTCQGARQRPLAQRCRLSANMPVFLQTYPELEVSPTVQAAALLGAGLLHRGTCHRYYLMLQQESWHPESVNEIQKGHPHL